MSPASEPGDLESVPEPLRSRVFQVRPVWQRFLVVLAGPAANFLLAILIYTAFYSLVGTPQTNVVGEVVPKTAAAAAGIKPGDRIISVAHRETPTFEAIANVVLIRPDENIPVEIERGGTKQVINVTLGSQMVADGPGRKFKTGVLGIHSTTAINRPVPIFRALPMACRQTGQNVRSLVDGLGKVLSGHVSTKQLGGPITIARVAGSGAELGLLPFIGLLAFLSINLGFINLLPVPMLDGGHLFFYVIEAVRRRPLSAQALEMAFRGGLALVFALMLFLTVNDLGRLGLWDGLQRLIG
jgi:regulator of sigma E protease